MRLFVVLLLLVANVAAAPSPQHANRRSIQPLPNPGGEASQPQ